MSLGSGVLRLTQKEFLAFWEKLWKEHSLLKISEQKEVSVTTGKKQSRGYVPSAWDLPWQERAEINAMYAEMQKDIDMAEKDYLQTAFNEVEYELFQARAQFPAFNSAHEGFAVLDEEVDELWQEVKVKQGKRNLANLRKEAVQVAAMAMRFIVDVCDEQRGQK
jgi:hypothetical protein